MIDDFEIVTAFTVGFVIEEQERKQSDSDRYDLATRDALVGADHPLTVAAGHRIFADPDRRFSQHLDRIVPGLVAPPPVSEG